MRGLELVGQDIWVTAGAILAVLAIFPTIGAAVSLIREAQRDKKGDGGTPAQRVQTQRPSSSTSRYSGTAV